MRDVWKLGFGLGCILVGLGACGGSTDESSASPQSSASPVPKDQFATRLAAAICDNIGNCCQSAGFAYDAAGCKDLLVKFYQTEIASDKASYDATKAGECVSWAASVSQTCASNPAPGPCDQVFTGTVPNGGACTSSVDCVKPAGGGVYCDSSHKCVQEPRGKEGDGCFATCTESGSSLSCGSGVGPVGGGNATCYTNDGLYCAQSGQCEKLAAIGASCATDMGCVAGAWCDSQSHKCVATVPAGSACTDDAACQEGNYCDPVSSKCAAAKANGSACERDSECAGGRCWGGKCTVDSIASPMTCSGAVN